MSRPFDPSCSDRALLQKAARVIEATARELKAAHNGPGRWLICRPADASAKAHYDEEMHLVRELRARARMADTERVP